MTDDQRPTSRPPAPHDQGWIRIRYGVGRHQAAQMDWATMDDRHRAMLWLMLVAHVSGVATWAWPKGGLDDPVELVFQDVLGNDVSFDTPPIPDQLPAIDEVAPVWLNNLTPIDDPSSGGPLCLN